MGIKQDIKKQNGYYYKVKEQINENVQLSLYGMSMIAMRETN